MFPKLHVFNVVQSFIPVTSRRFAIAFHRLPVFRPLIARRSLTMIVIVVRNAIAWSTAAAWRKILLFVI
jgi:hypothetical protein